MVILDSTIATPFLYKPLQRKAREERLDYVLHSYTKDLTGNGNTTAGVVIAENYRMFLPKGDTFQGVVGMRRCSGAPITSRVRSSIPTRLSR